MRIREYIRSKGVTIAALAECVGVSRTAMSWVVNHGRFPRGKDKKGIEETIRAVCGMSDEEYSHFFKEIEEKTEKIPKEVEMLSSVAREKFKLVRDPFVDDVRNSGDVYVSREHRYIRQSMYMCAKHGGFLAVVGESGSGKSTLRRELLSRIEEEKLPILVVQPKTVDKTRLTAQSICEAILSDVSPSVRPKRSLEGKARQIEQVLSHSSRSGHKHVLIIEEAHDLSIKTLKYLKRFWEMEDGFTKLLAIIVIGQPEMRYMLDEGRNYDAREVIRRIEVAQLQPLDKPGEIEKYMRLKFSRIGVEWEDIASEEVGGALRDKLTRQSVNGQVYSMAYPLILNNVCKKALNLASELGAKKIDAEIIKNL